MVRLIAVVNLIMRSTLHACTPLIWALCLCISLAKGQIRCELSGFIDTIKNRDNKAIFDLYSGYLANINKPDFSVWCREEKEKYTVPDFLLGGGIFDPTIYRYHYRFQVTDIRPLDDHNFIIKTQAYTLQDSIYNGMALLNTLCRKTGGQYFLANFADYYTAAWPTRDYDRLHYTYFPGFPFDELDAKRAAKFVDSIIHWFSLPASIHVDYYIARDCEEIQRIRGFEFIGYEAGAYEPLCGFFDANNIVFSNAKEGADYEHELVHLLNKYYPNCHFLIKMGLSAYISSGTSGHLGRPLPFHYLRIAGYLDQHPDLDLSRFIEFNQLDAYTNPAYATGAIIIHNLLKKGGLPLLLKCMSETTTDAELYDFVRNNLLTGRQDFGSYFRQQYQNFAQDKSYRPLLRVE